MSAALSALSEGENLNTDEALAWLASQGIHTSPGALRSARIAGRLPYLKVQAKHRI